MDDGKIVDLYWARDEKAITESQRKYGRMLSSLSYSLLSSYEDAEECVNDTYLDAWNAMPEARPEFLGAFLSKITRRISIDRFRAKHRERRGGMNEIVSELDECIPSEDRVERQYENMLLRDEINDFLYSQPKEKRVMFVLRYFYSRSVSEIARQISVGESKVKTTLFRMRKELQERLEENELL